MYVHQQDIRAFHLGNGLSQANLKYQASKKYFNIDKTFKNYICVINQSLKLIMHSQFLKLCPLTKHSRISFV